MPPTVVLIHTMPGLIGPFTAWCGEVLPEARVLHILDEPLLERIRSEGQAGDEDDERLAGHLAAAGSIGAHAALVTCSTVSPLVDHVRDRFPFPVVAIDDSMVAEAARLGSRVTVVATSTTTIGPTRARLEAESTRRERPLTISTRFVDGAMAALLAGDHEAHDRLVAEAVRAAACDADVIVLAQATMARVLPALREPPIHVPVLASPPLALAELRRALAFDEPIPVASGGHEVHP
jgi:Asp/Glu/hydantoin racemase